MKKISIDAVNDACFKIAEKIKSENHAHLTLVAVSRGGLVPTTIIAHCLGIKELKFIRLSSYSDNEHTRAGIIDTTTDEIPNTADTCIIDDICDSGETLLYLRQRYPEAKIYTLINKNQTIMPDFSAMTEPNGLWINFPWEVD